MKTKSLGAGKHLDGAGLYLVKSRKETGKWILRLPPNGNKRRREMGLGRWPSVSIAEARDQAEDARRAWRNGVDPIAERQKLKQSHSSATVAEMIEGCFAAHKADLKNEGLAGKWMGPLKVHVLPKLGNVAIEEIDQHRLKELFEPIWHTKPVVAKKALSRMNLTLNHAAALGLDVDLQAVPKTKALLGKQRHVEKHFPSLPYIEVPAFYRLILNVLTKSSVWKTA
ncbi:hypothetical protein A8B75_00015 [Sphingomonadales bacterium EhC05]|nr:hypothetical protein A8B75_00015 [Sphingomonadales bacterium EhC05]